MCLTDVNKLESLLECPLSAEVQHCLSVVAECLTVILTDTATDRDSLVSTVSDEAATTVGKFMSEHGSWVVCQRQCITDHFNNYRCDIDHVEKNLKNC